MSTSEPSSLGISRHFKREAIIMLAVVLLPIAIGLAAAFVLPRFMLHNKNQACASAQEQNAACKPQPQERR